MKYNQAGIAFMPKAPKTAEATAITILRSLSHQFDFVAIRFKLRVRLKTMIRACPNAVPHKKGKRDKKKSGKSAGNRLSERILLFAAITAATTGRTAVRRLVQRESHICRAAGGSRTAVHKLQLLVRHKADIHFGNFCNATLFSYINYKYL